jgi:hypothetical protein
MTQPIRNSNSPSSHLAIVSQNDPLLRIPLGSVFKSFCSFGYVKASELNDRKASCIELIQRALRSFNRESFHVSPKCKNF